MHDSIGTQIYRYSITQVFNSEYTWNNKIPDFLTFKCSFTAIIYQTKFFYAPELGMSNYFILNFTLTHYALDVSVWHNYISLTKCSLM